MFNREMSEKLSKNCKEIKYSNYLSKDKHVIFLFHGVVPSHEHKVRNYIRKHISLNRFRTVIQDLVKKGKAISMDEVTNIIQKKGVFPEFSYSITFDDGFENNLTEAAPILLELDIPFIIYITTNFIDKQEMSWIDKIEYAVEFTKVKKIRLPWGNKFHFIDSIKKKKELLSLIRYHVKNSRNINEDEVVKSLSYQMGISKINKDKFLDKKISWKQIQKFSNNNLVSFGGHSHNHRILSYLSEKELSFEVGKCLDLLNVNANVRTLHFSYPEGLKNCYSKKVISTLKKFNIKCCPTAISGLNTNNTDLFQLKRISVV